MGTTPKEARPFPAQVDHTAHGPFARPTPQRPLHGHEPGIRHAMPGLEAGVPRLTDRLAMAPAAEVASRGNALLHLAPPHQGARLGAPAGTRLPPPGSAPRDDLSEGRPGRRAGPQGGHVRRRAASGLPPQRDAVPSPGRSSGRAPPGGARGGARRGGARHTPPRVPGAAPPARGQNGPPACPRHALHTQAPPAVHATRLSNVSRLLWSRGHVSSPAATGGRHRAGGPPDDGRRCRHTSGARLVAPAWPGPPRARRSAVAVGSPTQRPSGPAQRAPRAAPRTSRPTDAPRRRPLVGSAQSARTPPARHQRQRSASLPASGPCGDPRAPTRARYPPFKCRLFSYATLGSGGEARSRSRAGSWLLGHSAGSMSPTGRG
jgi:hypothetical protein